MDEERMQRAADDLILHRAAERMLNEGKSREHVNEYLIKTPLEQIKTGNLEADRNRI